VFKFSEENKVWEIFSTVTFSLIYRKDLLKLKVVFNPKIGAESSIKVTGRREMYWLTFTYEGRTETKSLNSRRVLLVTSFRKGSE